MAKEEKGQFGELLSGYLDGELDAEETALVERALREDEDARRLLQELRRTADVVVTLPRHAAPPSILEDVRSRLERGELLGDFEDRRGMGIGWRRPVAALLSMAAVLALAAIGVWYVRERPVTDSTRAHEAVTMASDERELNELREPLAMKGTSGERSRTALRRRRGVAAAPEAGVEGKKRAVPKGKGPPSPLRPEKAVVTMPSPEKPAVALIQRSEVNLLATANVDQKLATSLRVAELRQHPFSNEKIRLQVVANDEAQRERVAAELVSALAQRRIADLAKQEGSIPARAVGSAGFFYRGKPGINFGQARESQILVRVPARDFNVLLDEVEDLPVAGDRVTLFSGPFGVRGLNHARKLLGDEVPESPRRSLDGREGKVAQIEEGARHAAVGDARRAGDRSGRGGETLTDFMEAVSIDRETFAGKPEREEQLPYPAKGITPERAKSARPQPPLQAEVPPESPAPGIAEAKPPPAVCEKLDIEDAPEERRAAAEAADVFAHRPAERPDEVLDDDAAMEQKRKPDASVAMADGSTLVGRRLKELAGPRQEAEPDREARVSSPTGPSPAEGRKVREPSFWKSRFGVTPPDQYLTVVVQFVVDEATPANASERERPAESTSRVKMKSSAASPRESTPQK